MHSSKDELRMHPRGQFLQRYLPTDCHSVRVQLRWY